jgi:hypothetical protein
MSPLDTFAAPGRFWRGNIHGHSTRSDGAWSPEEVCAAYAREGYDFIALTDHFLERYDFPLTDTSGFRSVGFTTILGAEVHAPVTSRGVEWHILAVGLPPDFAATTAGETGPTLARRCRDAGAFVAIAHPHWYNLTVEDALTIESAHAVEVYNHTCAVHAARGDGSAMWDALLSAGRPLTGIAADDSHFRHGARDGFGGWVMVKSGENTPDALLDALKSGHFYASQGPRIDDVRLEADRLIVDCSPATEVYALGPGSVAKAVSGPALRRVDFQVEPFRNAWLRIVVKDATGKTAWTNAHRFGADR